MNDKHIQLECQLLVFNVKFFGFKLSIHLILQYLLFTVTTYVNKSSLINHFY